MPDAPIVPLKSSRLVILEEGQQGLRVRTRVGSWWIGSVGMLFLLSIAGKGIWRLGEEVLAGRWLAAALVLLGYSLGVAFVGLFANSLTHERLVVERGMFEVSWRLGPWALRKRRVAVTKVREIACGVIKRQEDPDLYFLEINGAGWSESFGSETSDTTLLELISRLRKLGLRTTSRRRD